MDLVISAISQGILWGILSLGLFISFRILNIADMTTEGSFPLGAATCVMCIQHGVHPLLATFIAMFVGALAGYVTGFLITLCKLPSLLAGILTMTGLLSVNLRIMGRPNLSLLNYKTIFSFLEGMELPKYFDIILIGSVFVGILIVAMYVFFATEIGQALIATGDNEKMAISLGINTNRMTVFGLMLSNALIAMAGAVLAQNNGYADMNMGTGTIVNGLASIILAEVIVKYLPLGKRLWSIVVGSILYRLVLVVILAMNVDAQMLKLASAILLALILYVPEIRQKLQIKANKTLTPGGDS